MTTTDIKAWLKAHKRTQTWLASVLGVDVKTVNKWVNGVHEVPSYLKENLIQIAEQAISDETKLERDLTFIHKVGTMRAGEAAKLQAIGLTADELFTASASIGKTPQELIRSILMMTACKLASEFFIE